MAEDFDAYLNRLVEEKRLSSEGAQALTQERDGALQARADQLILDNKRASRSTADEFGRQLGLTARAAGPAASGALVGGALGTSFGPAGMAAGALGGAALGGVAMPVADPLTEATSLCWSDLVGRRLFVVEPIAGFVRDLATRRLGSTAIIGRAAAPASLARLVALGQGLGLVGCRCAQLPRDRVLHHPQPFGIGLRRGARRKRQQTGAQHPLPHGSSLNPHQDSSACHVIESDPV